MPTLKGTVYKAGSKERVPGAILKATKGTSLHQAVANDDGDFEFTGLNAGKWELIAFDEESFPSDPKEIVLTKNQSGVNIWLSRLAGTADQRLGRSFFIGLCAAFVLYVALYFILHNILPRGGDPLSVALVNSITDLEGSLVSEEPEIAGKDLLEQGESLEADLSLVLDQASDLRQADMAIMQDLAARLNEALQANAREEAVNHLAELRALVENPSPPGFSFWDQEPLRFLEVFLWGVAGIMVKKIFDTGWYLRKKSFYREGIVMHAAHLITTPILVLVAVLLLSLVTLKLTLAGGNEITLDLSDPRIMVAFSFLLGTVPWPLWEFIRSTGKKALD